MLFPLLVSFVVWQWVWSCSLCANWPVLSKRWHALGFLLFGGTKHISAYVQGKIWGTRIFIGCVWLHWAIKARRAEWKGYPERGLDENVGGLFEHWLVGHRVSVCGSSLSIAKCFVRSCITSTGWCWSIIADLPNPLVFILD